MKPQTRAMPIPWATRRGSESILMEEVTPVTKFICCLPLWIKYNLVILDHFTVGDCQHSLVAQTMELEPIVRSSRSSRVIRKDNRSEPTQRRVVAFDATTFVLSPHLNGHHRSTGHHGNVTRSEIGSWVAL